MLLTLHLLSNPVPTPKIAHNTRYFDFFNCSHAYRQDQKFIIDCY